MKLTNVINHFHLYMRVFRFPD